jgi:hypothetical protein
MRFELSPVRSTNGGEGGLTLMVRLPPDHSAAYSLWTWILPPVNRPPFAA